MKGKLRDFRLLDKGFEFRGQTYPDSEIAHIFLGTVHTVFKTNFVETGERYSIRVKITLKTGEMLQLHESEGGGIVSEIASLISNRDDKFLGLRDAVEALMRRTFKLRLSAYEKQIKTLGYFTYDECHFYPFDKIVYRNQEFRVNESRFFRGGGFVEMRRRNFSIMDRIRREVAVFAKIPQFNTQTDSDVILFLLDRYFGIRWN